MSADTLPKLLMERAKALGGKVGLRDKNLGVWRPITWNEYLSHVEIFCLGLISLGLEREDKVSILGDNCPEWLYADLAAQSAGAVAVGVYPTNSAEQVKYILKHSDSKYVVVKDQEQLDKVLEVKESLPFLSKVIVIDMKGVRKYKDPVILSYQEVDQMGRQRREREPDLFPQMVSRTRSDDTAIIVYTSGTTGPPKAAMLSHRNITSVVNSFLAVLSVNEKDSLVSALPLCHVAERLFSLFLPMKTGCTINFAESVATLQSDMIEISPTIFLTVPRILEKLHSAITIKIQDADRLKRWAFNLCLPVGSKIAELELSRRKANFLYQFLYGIAYYLVFRPLRNKIGLLQVRECVSGAAPLSVDLIRFFYSIGIKVKEAYGATESTGLISMPEGTNIKIGSVGKPVPGVAVTLAADREIIVESDCVFKGYYKDPAATERVVKSGLLYTGDIGSFDEEGNLYIVDRKKEIIITASGKNIAPSEIENRLKFSPYINEVIVIGEGKKYITALVQIDYENVSNWALKEGIPFTTYKSLARNEKVRGMIEGEIAKVNKNLSRVESIKKFAILEKELDRDDDELTATMKVRREMIEKKYKDIIGKLYKSDS